MDVYKLVEEEVDIPTLAMQVVQGSIFPICHSYCPCKHGNLGTLIYHLIVLYDFEEKNKYILWL